MSKANKIVIIVLLLAAVLLSTQSIMFPAQPKRMAKTPKVLSDQDQTLIFLGDTMLGRSVSDCIVKNPPEFVWGDTLPILKSADAVIDNLEAVIAKGGKPWQPEKVFYFKADPKAINVLKAGNVTYVANANNHAMDFDREALLEMLDLLDGAKIAHSGAGKNLGEAMEPAILNVGPLKMAIIAWTDNEPDWKAGEDLPGVHYLKVNNKSLKLLAGQIEQAREVADLVTVSAHWGPNMVEYPPKSFQSFARGVIDAGADIFFGHSSHVFQGVEVYKGKLIMYDTGDFVDDYVVDSVLRNDMSFIFRVKVDSSGPIQLELIPVLINGKEFCQVNLAHGTTAEEIMEMMKKRSKSFGTQFNQQEASLTVPVR